MTDRKKAPPPSREATRRRCPTYTPATPRDELLRLRTFPAWARELWRTLETLADFESGRLSTTAPRLVWLLEPEDVGGRGRPRAGAVTTDMVREQINRWITLGMIKRPDNHRDSVTATIELQLLWGRGKFARNPNFPNLLPKVGNAGSPALARPVGRQRPH